MTLSRASTSSVSFRFGLSSAAWPPWGRSAWPPAPRLQSHPPANAGRRSVRPPPGCPPAISARIAGSSPGRSPLGPPGRRGRCRSLSQTPTTSGGWHNRYTLSRWHATEAGSHPIRLGVQQRSPTITAVWTFSEHKHPACSQALPLHPFTAPRPDSRTRFHPRFRRLLCAAQISNLWLCRR